MPLPHYHYYLRAPTLLAVVSANAMVVRINTIWDGEISSEYGYLKVDPHFESVIKFPGILS
jgi:hypothetical protein